MRDVLEPPDEPARPVPAVRQGPPPAGPADPPAVDVAAFSAFYRAETRSLVNFLLWMGAGVADAADLGQDTMIDLYQRWATVQHPRAWIRSVASRKLGRQRLAPDTATVELLVEDHNPLLGAPDAVAAWEQRREVLRLLAFLPWRQRQVMAWTFDGYQPQQIAAELDIAPEAVRASLKLARRALVGLLGQEEDQKEEAGGTA